MADNNKAYFHPDFYSVPEKIAIAHQQNVRNTVDPEQALTVTFCDNRTPAEPFV